jgi:transketolase
MKELTDIALDLRKTIIKMNYVSGSGHITSSCSCLEILVALYFGGVLRYDPQKPLLDERDYLILSKGHAAIGLYAVLSRAGFFPESELWSFCAVDTRLGGHPSIKIPGVEANSGSLGHGLPFSVGLALGARQQKKQSRVYCITGDGELQEGSVWEAALSIAHFKLDNLVWIVDKNNLQINGTTDEIMSLGHLHEKLTAFGFEVFNIDGHSFSALHSAMTAASSKPRVIIANTVKGCGIDSIAGKPGWHGRKPDKSELAVILSDLGMQMEDLNVEK